MGQGEAQTNEPKNVQAFENWLLQRPGEFWNGFKGFLANDRYQNVDLGLEFLLEAPKSKNIASRTEKYRK